MYRHVATNKYKCCSVMCYKAPLNGQKIKSSSSGVAADGNQLNHPCLILPHGE